MAKLNDQFAEFLSNIEPDEDAIKYAQKAHQPVRKHLEEDDDFGEFFEDSFLYGSYARHTAIGEIKDIDIVVLTNFDPNNEDYSPTKVLKKLKTALNKFYKDADNTEYQRKSVKVKDPLPNYPNVYMTLDIIPAIAIDGVDNPLLKQILGYKAILKVTWISHQN
jgi:tRNA nucleotidyltransferase (CCA-adding enzyme)